MDIKFALPEKSPWKIILIPLTLILFAGCGGKKASPLNDPLFRLQTPTRPPNCPDEQSKQVCRWKIRGEIQGFEVVQPGENPFSRCSNCKFSQKFSIKDNGGTVHIFYYQFPKDDVIPLVAGKKVELNYIDGSGQNRGYAFSLLDDTGNLIAGGASGEGGELFTSEKLSSIEISPLTDREAGRISNECGTKIFRPLKFKIGGKSLTLSPGESKVLETDDGFKYRITAVNFFNWENSRCPNNRSRTFSFYLYKTADSK